ncbi:MAG: outer membrane protein assembly factor BamA [Elusimicrobiales bacterium]|nr:outer membrane protein assembly factor BamA [Elusimicrobiales bacterium]HOL62861.1 outer membrane protein assembly factor BamA [Elusimicrobiales bacterium]HPO95808.1 outer membrane protein assembly factor BamA [Elusimicrobiales bacterium]
MKIFLIIGFFSLFNLFAASPGSGPWQVNEIEVLGVKNLKPKVILKTVKAKRGKIYYEEDKKTDIENLINLGSLERVSVEIVYSDDKNISAKNFSVVGDTNPIKVIYTVYEKPYIEDIIINGAKKISKSSVKSEMDLSKGDFYDEVKLKDDISKIYKKYKEKGYINANIEYDVKIDSQSGKAVLNLNIFEGEKIIVGNLVIDGVRSFKTKKIIKKMKNRPKKVFLEEDLKKDFYEIENFYKNNGFADFKIIDSTFNFREGKYADINIKIEEGGKYFFGDTAFSGNKVYNSAELMSAVEYQKGKIFKDEKLTDTIRNIQERYADKGYLKVIVSTVSSYRDNYIDLSFVLEENFPIYVRYIDVEGNKSTKTKVFKREIVQKEGDVFSLSKIRRSQEKIFNLGFIENVELMINPSDSPDTVDLVFDVSEGKPGMLTAGAGLSSRDGFVGMISVSHMNMFGLAQRFSLNWNFGKRVQDYSVNWTTPWLNDKPTSLGISLFNNRRYRSYSSTYSAYTEKRTGGRVSIGPRFEDDKYALNFSYSYEKIRIYDVDDIYKSEIAEGTSVQSSISAEFTRDTRDYIWDPTKGTKFSLGVEVFGGLLGGDLDLYKPTISYSYNKKLFSIDEWPFVFSVASRFGWVKEFGSTKTVPVYERYFLGGADTIRGYDTNGQIGPKDGGKVYYITNAEFKFPLAREKKRTIVQWAFFFDIGNSWEGFDNISLKTGSKLNQLKCGAGFGIRFTTPAFPIRLDWGYGFNHKPGENLSDIYFTIGNLF